MYIKGFLIVTSMLIASRAAYAEDVSDEIHEACKPRISPVEKSIKAALIRHLGEWTNCTVKHYAEEEFGLNALIVMQWGNVKLSTQYLPPEAAIYTVEITGSSPLTSEWYTENQKNLVDGFFDMNWERDKFPGPTSEYYISPEIGTNAQFWTESDKAGNVTWMRFSYAL